MAVANVNQRQKSVADPNTAYESMRPLWGKSRAIIGGERFTKDYDGYLDTVGFSNLLIPFSPSMSQRQYAFYKAEAELPGIVSQYTRILNGGLLRKQPQVKLPEDAPEDAYDWIMTGFSQNGSPIVSFLSEALEEELQTSRAWVYVDYPKIENPESMTQEEMLAFKPYPILWKAESIINWKLGMNPNTGRQTLEQVIIRNYEESYEFNEFHPSYIDTVWVHELYEGYYRIRKYQKRSEDSQMVVINGKVQQQYQTVAAGNGKDENVYELVEINDNILINGERLDRIPAWPLNGNVSIVEPMLLPLIDKEVSLYNKLSRRNHLLYGAATYTPIISSDMPDEDFEAIVDQGLGSWIRLRQGDSATVLETPTMALADMDRAIISAVEDMAKLGVRMLTPETAQSGVALNIRNAGQTAQLGTLNTKVGNQMASVIAFMLNWRYGTEYSSTDIGFELSTDFNSTPLGADWLRLATEWYEKGFIPRSIWMSMLKQNDMLLPDYDDQKGQEEIVNDEIVFTAKDNQDFMKEQSERQMAMQEEQFALSKEQAALTLETQKEQWELQKQQLALQEAAASEEGAVQ